MPNLSLNIKSRSSKRQTKKRSLEQTASQSQIHGRNPLKDLKLADNVSVKNDSKDNLEKNTTVLAVSSSGNTTCESTDSVMDVEAATLNDLKSWVSSQLANLNLDKLPDIIDEGTLLILQSLLNERARYQTESCNLATINSRLQSELTQNEKEKERDVFLQNAQSQEIKSLNNKVSALNQEHNEAKSNWLVEKNELLSRVHQVQALQTQYQGTLRKKEKEFETMQKQYAKLITRETSRSSSSSSMRLNSATTTTSSTSSAPSVGIIISKPLQKNLSQSIKPSGTIRDTELLLKQKELFDLEDENAELKEEVCSLKSYQEQIVIENDEKIMIINEKHELVQKKLKSERESLLKQLLDQQSLTQDLLSKQSIDLKQSYQAKVDDVYNSLKQTTKSLESSRLTHEQTTQELKHENEELKKHLDECKKLLDSQDKVIHSSLFEKLPTYSAVKASIAHDPMDCDPDQDVEVMEMKKNLMPFVSPIASSYTNRRVSRSIRSSAVKKSHSSVSGSLAMIDFKDEDFLPPASPATVALLKQCGWKQLPSTADQ